MVCSTASIELIIEKKKPPVKQINQFPEFYRKYLCNLLILLKIKHFSREHLCPSLQYS